MAFKGNIELLTEHNKNYRKVLYTNKKQQLVLMSIPPKLDIGMERHKHTSQFIRVEEGHGKAIIGGKNYRIKEGDAVVIPPGSYHNIINTDKETHLKLYTIYCPPIHKDRLIQKDKVEE